MSYTLGRVPQSYSYPGKPRHPLVWTHFAFQQQAPWLPADCLLMIITFVFKYEMNHQQSGFQGRFVALQTLAVTAEQKVRMGVLT